MNPEDLLKHPNPEVRAIWEKSSRKEYGDLFQGFGETKGMDALQFLRKADIPAHEKVACPPIVVAHRPEKAGAEHRTRFTGGAINWTMKVKPAPALHP